MCFQDDLLFPHLSVLENVAFPLRARGTAKQPRAPAPANCSGGSRRGATRPRSRGALSGGERQRVSLARALATDPRLLLLDEPLAGVDVTARGQIRSLLREVADGFDGVVVLVAHDPLDALTLADRVAIMEGGRLTQEGTPDEIRRAPRSAYAADLVGVNLFTGRAGAARGRRGHAADGRRLDHRRPRRRPASRDDGVRHPAAGRRLAPPRTPRRIGSQRVRGHRGRGRRSTPTARGFGSDTHRR